MNSWEAESSSAATGPASRRRRPRWWPVIPLGVVALLVAILVAQKPSIPLVAAPDPPRTVASSTTGPPSTAGSWTGPTASSGTATSTGTGAETTATTGTAAPTPQVTRVAHPILGIVAGWELFAATDDGLIRVEPAAGRVTVTRSREPLGDGGSVQLVVGSDSALVMVQDDDLSGIMIHDGQPARPLPKELAVQPAALPGPSPGQWWVVGALGAVAATSPWAARLLTADGRPEGRQLGVPSGPQGYWLPDGRGGLLYLVADGIYRVGPDGPSRISTGGLVAQGGAHVLMADCDDQLHCRRTLIDLDTGDRRQVPRPDIPDDYWVADMSADGELLAAVPQDRMSSQVRVVLADLRTGRTRTVRVAIDPSGWPSVALSSDHAWLFLIGDEGKLRAFDTATGTEHPLGLDLPPVRAIAIRPATS